jgi:hypothetical protein
VRIGPADALQILLRRGWRPNDAAMELTLAMQGDACQLWCNANPVATRIKLTLAVEARAEPGGRWGATIVSTAREPWEHPPDYYRWEFDDSEVAALLPPPTPLPSPADTPPRRKPGPPPKKDWPMHVARELIRRARAGQKMPTAPQMLQYCQNTLRWEHDIRAMQRLLRDLLGG